MERPRHARGESERDGRAAYGRVHHPNIRDRVGMGGAIGGLAGILVAPSLFLDTNLMSAILIKAFAGAVLGGLNSLVGVFCGCLALGVAENLAGAYVSPSFADAITFIIIIAVLVVRPAGVLGTMRMHKA